MWLKAKENKGFLLILFAIFVIKTSIFDWNFVPTGSMRPTISDGDQIFINKLAYNLYIPLTKLSILKISDPKRWDIITFDSKSENMRMAKRIIGLPGDKIKIVNNILYINESKASYNKAIDSEQLRTTFKSMDDLLQKTIDGRKITIDYIKESLFGFKHLIRVESTHGNDPRLNKTIVVPNEMYFVLGDNRNNSRDSRFWGFVNRREIIGHVIGTVFSLDKNNHYFPRANRTFISFK